VLIVDDIPAGADAAPDWTVLDEAIFQLTAPGIGWTDPAAAGASLTGDP
jgi:hypothetical protein